jgi:PAS domain S-box-containing protein
MGRAIGTFGRSVTWGKAYCRNTAMANRRTISLRTKISVVTTLTVIAVALMLGGLNVYNQLTHIRKFEERFLRDSVRSAATISYTIMPFLVSDNFISMNSLISYYGKRSDRLYILVVDKNDRVMADSRGGETGGKYEPLPAYRTDEVGEGIVRRFSLSGKEAIEVAYPVKADDRLVGKVVLGLNMSWLQEEIGLIRKTMIVSTGIALAVISLGILLASALAKRVSQPVRLLTQAAEKVGRGDYSQRIQVESSDEIGVLADTFDAMLVELRSARTQLVEKNLLQARLRLAHLVLSHSLEELIQATLDEVEALTGSLIGFYHFLEEDQKTLSLQAWSTNTLKTCSAGGNGGHYDIEEAGAWADCIRERRAVIHNDYSALKHRKGLPPGHADVVRQLVVPVFRGERIVAILGVGNKPHAYEAGDVETVSFLADLAWDLVERKRAGEALLESEERYRSVVENVSIGIAVISPRMEILSLNRTMKTWFPDIAVQEKPLCYRSFYHPPKNETCSYCPTFLTLKDGQVHETITETLSQGKTVNHRVLSSPIRDQSGNVVAAIEMVENITERRRAEEALRASEARLKDAQHIAHIGNWAWDVETGRIEWSEELYRIYGYAPYEISPDYRFMVDAMHPKSRDAFVGAIDAAIKAGMPFEMDYTFFRKEGSEATLHAIGRIIYDDNGVPVRMVGTVQDITDRKSAEEQIRTSLLEKEILLKEIHHRVKNNLQVVASMLSLQSRYLDDQKAKAMFEDSRRRVESMSLIHEKLYRSKDLAKIDFREYVRDLVSNVTALNAGSSGRVQIVEDIGEVVLDVNKGIPCGLIINELLSNALRHAFPEGQGGKIVIGMRGDGSGRIALTVRDNGMGFPDQIDFRKTKSLGMQIVISLVSQLEGTIELDKSEGSAFTMTFQT